MTDGGNGGNGKDYSCRAVCDEHQHLSLEALRASRDAVAAAAAVREESAELRRLVANVGESVGECLRIVNAIVAELAETRTVVEEHRTELGLRLHDQSGRLDLLEAVLRRIEAKVC